MGNFIIKPEQKEFARVYDNTFLLQEDSIYIMANHRLALWCWLQCENIFDNQHNLIHIDEHIDARAWEGPGEAECLLNALNNFVNLKDFNIYEGLQCPLRNVPNTNRTSRPCITWDNFIHLAAKADLFRHFYIYSSVGDWRTGLSEDRFSLHKSVSKVYNLSQDILKSNGKCIIDIDLDFFDKRDGFKKGLFEDELLKRVFSIIANHRDKISMITISINESPGDTLWDKRQHQLSIIKKILQINIPIPIISLV